MLNKKLKELENKRKKMKKEKLEKKKRAERRKKREEKRKLDEKKALQKRKKLQARRQAILEEKLAKQREIEKAKAIAKKEKEKEQRIKEQEKRKREKLEEKEKLKKQKETEKFLKERQKKHQKYLEIKEKMEERKLEVVENEVSENFEILDEAKNVKKEKSRKEKKKTNSLSIIFFIICIAVLAYSSYQIYIWVKSTQDLVTIEEEVIDKVVKEIKDTSKDYSIDINFEELVQINSDVVGWIYIKNTDVNYPIMQAKDNDYYLKKNIYKQYSSCGSIFLDCDTDKFNEDNTVIYGHNLKNQKMFADLKKIYDGEFGKDVYIEVYDTENNFIKYKIFATYMVEPTLEVVKKDFKISEKKKYIDNAYNQSTVKFNCGFNYQKDLLTLVTCDNTGEKRIIVNALRIN